MRQKLTCLLLAGALTLGLAACAAGEEAPGPGQTTSQPAETSAPSQPAESIPPSQPVETAPPSEAISLPPEPSDPPVLEGDLPQRDYQPWQTGYMEFLARLRQTENESPWEQEAYRDLAADGRGSLGIWSVDEDMAFVMRTGSERYSLYDVDRDGVPELIVDYAGWAAQCYAWRDGQVVCVGEFHSKDSGLYSHPNKNAILRAGGRMGYYELYEYPMEGGVLTEERVIFSEGPVDFPTEAEEIVPGAEYIDYYYTWLGEYDMYKGYAPESEWHEFDDGRPHPSAGKALLLPIADYYDGPAATGDSSEQARTAILAALNGETELYGASGDHFYGDMGWSSWKEYVQPGAACPYNEEPLEITAHIWLDLNGDGQEECVLRLETRDEANIQGAVVLSEQDGTVYAYYFGFYFFDHEDGAVLCTDGTVRNTYTGKGTVRLSFWKGQCYEYMVRHTAADPVKWVDGPPAG